MLHCPESRRIYLHPQSCFTLHLSVSLHNTAKLHKIVASVDVVITCEENNNKPSVVILEHEQYLGDPLELSMGYRNVHNARFAWQRLLINLPIRYDLYFYCV